MDTDSCDHRGQLYSFLTSARRKCCLTAFATCRASQKNCKWTSTQGHLWHPARPDKRANLPAAFTLLLRFPLPMKPLLFVGLPFEIILRCLRQDFHSSCSGLDVDCGTEIKTSLIKELAWMTCNEFDIISVKHFIVLNSVWPTRVMISTLWIHYLTRLQE